MMQSCILEPEYASCIYRVSFISFLSSIYAIYCECYDLAPVPGGVFLTSINYWRNPVYGWRRNLDMSYVASALIYQNYRAYHLLMSSSSSSSSSSSHMPALLVYYTLTGISMGCYCLSLQLYKKKDIWGSTYVHCLVHLLANIANIFLYNQVSGLGGGGVGVGMGNGQPPSGGAPAFCPRSDAPFFR
jgi:hypothetical protein